MKTIFYTGNLRKMSAKPARPVEYSLVLFQPNLVDSALGLPEEEPQMVSIDAASTVVEQRKRTANRSATGMLEIPLNQYLGCDLQLRFTGNIHCIECGRRTKQSFQQGYCYPCFQRLAECNFCVIHPEKCAIAHAPCPENDWAHAQCNQPHIVYLANSSGLKVGITRHHHTPSRWIDQGASQALPIFQVANRYQAGVIEVCLKQFLNDKTDWRKLLKQTAPPVDLLAERTRILAQAETVLSAVIAGFAAGEIIPLQLDTVTQLEFPVQRYLEKATAWSFDKSPVIAGKLQGIKGQYLLFESGAINIRKFAGYEVEFTSPLVGEVAALAAGEGYLKLNHDF